MPANRTQIASVTTALLALVATAFAGCGDSGGKRLTSARASELRSTLAQVQQDVATGDCASAASEAQALEQKASSLPSRIDGDLKRSLVDSAARLRELVQSRCSQTTTETTPTTETGPTGTTGPTTTGKQKEQKPKKEKKPGKGNGKGNGNGNGEQTTPTPDQTPTNPQGGGDTGGAGTDNSGGAAP